jgi:hypothetical protein
LTSGHNFCHSAPMETHAFGFRLRANAPEGQKRFPISGQAITDAVADLMVARDRSPVNRVASSALGMIG